jgi:hypothetical protein
MMHDEEISVLDLDRTACCMLHACIWHAPRRLVAGGWWLVAGGWWLVAGGWWHLKLTDIRLAGASMTCCVLRVAECRIQNTETESRKRKLVQ